MSDNKKEMKCHVCVKELVLGYVDPEKDYKLCKNCAFRDGKHTYSDLQDKTENKHDR